MQYYIHVATQLLSHDIKHCLMNDFFLGIERFYFVEAEKFKNYFCFFLVSFLISHPRLSMF